MLAGRWYAAATQAAAVEQWEVRAASTRAAGKLCSRDQVKSQNVD
jgi:hypothetical protein